VRIETAFILCLILAEIAERAVPASASTFRPSSLALGPAITSLKCASMKRRPGGSGNASHLGRFTYVLNATVSLVNGSSTGIFLLALTTVT